MDFYTLTDQFLTKDPIDDFVSAIWTERYSVAGDVRLVVPANSDMIDLLAPGTYLALRGSQEVMNLETESIEKGLMTVVGQALPTFLNQRVAWFRNPATDPPLEERIVDYTDSTKAPGAFISDVVNKMVINTVPFTGVFVDTNLTWDMEEIPNLVLGPIDASGVVKRLTLPIGPLYDGISKIAAEEGVGIALYLDSASPITGYILKFKTYKGIDHTTGSGNPLVRLTPELDSIQDLKEIRSNSLYKNVAYVYYQGKISKHLAEPTLPEPEGMERRVVVTNAEGEPVGRKVDMPRYGNWGGYTSYVVGPGELTAFREQHAKNVFANANYISAIDGQTSPQNDYKYGVDYSLGDIIELEGLTGILSKARVTEYIRTQDQTGEREYPTIATI